MPLRLGSDKSVFLLPTVNLELFQYLRKINLCLMKNTNERWMTRSRRRSNHTNCFPAVVLLVAFHLRVDCVDFTGNERAFKERFGLEQRTKLLVGQ